jgi:protein tyrosine phosphatase (PTP) superfamily phosphohydrolase (DUF442 family)
MAPSLKSHYRFICGAFVISAVLLSQPWARASGDLAKSATNGPARTIQIPGIENAFRAADRIYSGSQPESDEAYAAIAKLGVKTIVSVDGSKPDVEAAHRHGLRYVHLPFGYDGVPTSRVVELAKVSAEAGPFFVHCHHGKHRGPAAVAIMCLAKEEWTREEAVEWLHEAGTAVDYPGLYRAAREYSRPSKEQLAAVKELPEVAITPALVDTMVTIDALLDRLKLSQQAGWKTPPGHADVSPAHEAIMLWEQFKEVARTEKTAKRPADFRAKLTEAEQAADALRKLLGDSKDAVAIDAAFKRSTQSCGACHKKYRNE